MKKNWVHWIIPVFFIFWLVLIYFNKPVKSNPNNFLPSCPVKSYTNLYCTGCGSTRSLHYLLHGDFAKAIAFHPLLIPALLYVILGWILSWIPQNQNIRKIESRLYGTKPTILILILLLLFTVVRNLPFEWASLLRPPSAS